MKKLRKLTGFLLAVVMVLGMSVMALAATTGTSANDKGTININDAEPEQTYTVYRILELESFREPADDDTDQRKAYSYKAAAAWTDFINGPDVKNVYVKVDAQGYVTWNGDPDDAENAAAFAKLAQKYAVENKIQNQGTAKAAGNSVKFGNLDLGYYLVDTTLGTLCSLDTTNLTVTIEEKNEVPTVDKVVKEDSTETYGAENTAQIGDTVEFKTTIHAKKGAQSYVLHDAMSEGLTLNADSIAVEGATVGTDYTVTTADLTDGCDFEITFTQAYLDKITTNTDIVITYSAVLNENAVISDGANTNKTKLEYSETNNTETTEEETKTYTFKFDIIKTDSNKKLLEGAKFELYDAQTAGTKIPLVKKADGTYRVATKEEANVSEFDSAVIEAGKVTVQGLDANTTYWLEETKAPEGYNKLAERVKVEIRDSNLTTTMTGDTWEENDGGVQITNQTGAELPSTGGMGTTIFYVLGSILVLGAGVLLVVKRRMSTEN